MGNDQYIKYFASLCTGDVNESKQVEDSNQVEGSESIDSSNGGIVDLGEVPSVNNVVNNFVANVQSYPALGEGAAYITANLFVPDNGTPKASLLATSSQEFRIGDKQILQYFKWFTAQSPHVVDPRKEDLPLLFNPKVQQIGKDTYLATAFLYVRGGGKDNDLATELSRTPTVFRFQFIICNEGTEGYKILSLHAEGIPLSNEETDPVRTLAGEPDPLPSPYS